MFNLTNKTALVLGSTRGLGKAIATSMSEAGARVATCSRNKSDAQIVADEIGNGAMGFVCDITDSTSVEAVMADVVYEFGHIDILVCNAASNILGTPLKMNDDLWLRVISTELTGYFYAARLPESI